MAPRRFFLRLSPDGLRRWTGAHKLDALTGVPLPAFAPAVPGRIAEGRWITPTSLAVVSEEAGRAHHPARCHHRPPPTGTRLATTGIDRVDRVDRVVRVWGPTAARVPTVC